MADSSQEIPIKYANGLKIQPKITCKVKFGSPTMPPKLLKIQLIKAITDTNAINIAPTFSAKCIPSRAPFAKASIALDGFSTSAPSFNISSVFSVCGNMILANNKPPGAAIKEAAIK